MDVRRFAFFVDKLFKFTEKSKPFFALFFIFAFVTVGYFLNCSKQFHQKFVNGGGIFNFFLDQELHFSNCRHFFLGNFADNSLNDTGALWVRGFAVFMVFVEEVDSVRK